MKVEVYERVDKPNAARATGYERVLELCYEGTLLAYSTVGWPDGIGGSSHTPVAVVQKPDGWLDYVDVELVRVVQN